MTIKSDLIISLKAQYPTIRSGSDENGYTVLDSADYEATISTWADIELTRQNEVAAQLAADQAQAARDAAVATKLASLGLTLADLKSAIL
jgi:hypothetical protein